MSAFAPERTVKVAAVNVCSRVKQTQCRHAARSEFDRTTDITPVFGSKLIPLAAPAI